MVSLNQSTGVCKVCGEVLLGDCREVETNVVKEGVVGEVGLEQDAHDSYASMLNRDRRWALMEGSRHFGESSAVFTTLHRIANQLNELGIPYSVVGGMAVFRHGLRRFTEDVDILVTRDGLKRIHAALDGRGFRPPFRNSKNLVDAAGNVKVIFLLTGEFPGDGKPKPVAFPDPETVSFEDDGISYVKLETLMEMKLASGMTDSRRLQDLADVQRLIQIHNLPADFAASLNPYVREKFSELWYQDRKRYILPWRNKGLTTKAHSIEEMAELLPDAAQLLRAMQADGVMMERGVADDHATLVTTDPLVAAKYDMVEESEYWPDEGSD